MAIFFNALKDRGIRNRVVSFAACAISVLLVAAVPAQAQTFTVLYSFQGGEDGADPAAGLIQDGAGNFYGTTLHGGAFPGSGGGVGTIFELDAGGTEKVLFSFTNQHLFGDGIDPAAALVRDASGGLYGTTGGGCSALFKLAPRGGMTLLHAFAGSPNDGCRSTAAVVRDCCGNLYGTSVNGGPESSLCPAGCGTVFRFDKNGKETVLRSFAGWDGAYPGSLLSAGGGVFYGTTSSVGLKNNFGTVFKIDSTGKEAVLYRFGGGADGANPVGSLVLDSTGALYGTTTHGGDPTCQCGVAFKLDASGKETVLTTFGPNGAGFPNAGLVADSAGNFYGTTGPPTGSQGLGQIFKLDAYGNTTVLYDFTGGADGAVPNGVLLGADGNLYGTASGGGEFGFGTIFKITL